MPDMATTGRQLPEKSCTDSYKSDEALRSSPSITHHKMIDDGGLNDAGWQAAQDAAAVVARAVCAGMAVPTSRRTCTGAQLPPTPLRRAPSAPPPLPPPPPLGRSLPERL